MKYLERHMKSILSQTCFHCSECGVSKATRQQLQSDKRSHKTDVCPHCSKVISLWNKHRHVKSCRGQVHERPRFQCDQCGKATKTAHGLEQHRIMFHEIYSTLYFMPEISRQTSCWVRTVISGSALV